MFCFVVSACSKAIKCEELVSCFWSQDWFE